MPRHTSPVIDSPVVPSTKLPRMDKVKATRVRSWHHSYESHPESSPPYTDTVSFAVSFVDDTTIVISDKAAIYGGEILKYRSYFTTDSTYSFHSHEGSTGGYTDNNLTYNFNKDKMYISLTFGGYGGGVYNYYVTID